MRRQIFFASVRLASIPAIFLFSANLFAATITVTTLDDVSDFAGAQQPNDLPGPDGKVSFREAVVAANNNAGPDTIAFAVPPSTFWLRPGIGLLRLEKGAFIVTGDATTIDFSTQTTNMGDTNPDGQEIGIYGLQPNGSGSSAIILNASDCVIKGMGDVHYRGHAVDIRGHRNRVIGSNIAGPVHEAIRIGGLTTVSATDNVVGGTAPGDGNVLSDVAIIGPADRNVVIGNPLIKGVRVEGVSSSGKLARNTRIGGPTVAERNVISGAGYWGPEGFPAGAQVLVVDADETLIENNFIGTTADGMQAYRPQVGQTGVEVRDARITTIRNNLIAGLRIEGHNHYAGQIFGQAIIVHAANKQTNATRIEGNVIGLAVDEVTPIETYSGIKIGPDSTIPTDLAVRIASNHIGAVETTGIFLGYGTKGVTLTANEIHDSGELGIDLATRVYGDADGPTANDAGDGDNGANNLQNFPVLQSATTSGSTITISGTLDSVASSSFTIEFFASPSCDPTGFGEGARYLGATTATTDASGHATFNTTLPANVVTGEAITATATRQSNGDTSEFSACIATTAAAPVAIVSATPASGFAPLNVQFSSSGSNAPSGAITSYFWDFGDGTTSTDPHPSHVYAAGNYTATLTVVDASGSTSSGAPLAIAANRAMRSLTVLLSGTVQGTQASLTGQVYLRDENGAGLGGATVYATWTRPDGSTSTTCVTTDAKGTATFRLTGGFGTYTLTLTNAARRGYAFDAANSVTTKSITVSGDPKKR